MLLCNVSQFQYAYVYIFIVSVLYQHVAHERRNRKLIKTVAGVAGVTKSQVVCMCLLAQLSGSLGEKETNLRLVQI